LTAETLSVTHNSQEGLAEYLNRPLEDRAFIDGIRDTASLIADENETLTRIFHASKSAL